MIFKAIVRLVPTCVAVCLRPYWVCAYPLIFFFFLIYLFILWAETLISV